MLVAAANWLETAGSPLWVLVIGTFVVHELIWLAANVPYMLGEKYGWFEAYKVKRVATRQNSTLQAQWHHFWSLLRGHVVMLLPVTAVTGNLLLWVGFSTSAELLPSFTTFCWQFLLFNVIEDTGFYWVHRWMHTSWAYKNIHVQHHLYDPPFSLSGELMHPAEFLFNVLVPLMLGPFLVAWYSGLHVFTYWTWMCFREIRGADAHSNVVIPYHPLRLLNWVYGGPRYHTIHHTKATKDSNFGGYLFWDWLMGTTIHPQDAK